MTTRSTDAFNQRAQTPPMTAPMGDTEIDLLLALRLQN
jgi:hypothetical protein